MLLVIFICLAAYKIDGAHGVAFPQYYLYGHLLFSLKLLLQTVPICAYRVHEVESLLNNTQSDIDQRKRLPYALDFPPGMP